MIIQDYNQALAYITALTGDPLAIMDWRAIHDRDKSAQAHNARGTLNDCWYWLCEFNAKNYGIFCVINETNGQGVHAVNIVRVRAHFVDLDNLSAMQNLAIARSWIPQPSFAVQSSPNKAHVYWIVNRYIDSTKFTLIQRKLITKFNGDSVIHDLPRVMRVPGFLHCKGEPVLTTCFALEGYSTGKIDVAALETALQDVAAHDSGGSRHELGDMALAAPSLDWIKFALANVDPNNLDRGEWIALTSAVKQSGWSVTTPDILFNVWSEWCGRYVANNSGENLKQWNSIRNTELGWHSIVRRVPAVHAHLTLGQSATLKTDSSATLTAKTNETLTTLPSAPPALDCSSEILTDIEQKEWFKGCVFVSRYGEILTPSGRMMNATKFNGEYGGKKFIIDQQAKLTNEPWQAALRSTLWTVPKADHLRFVPSRETGALIEDELGRKGVNTYKPAQVRSVPGDPSPFMRHLELMFPVADDRKILLDFLAHNAKFPGYKIPWAPLIQSAEGVGKGIFKEVIRHFITGPYMHVPNAKELVDSGSKFNAWMRAKLFIFVDEIKVDERRDMIEVLKPMISEKEIEIQGKGHDQDKEDNYSNWFFLSNYKDAIPVNKNSRRFSIFYSAIQSADDLISKGCDKKYFDSLYGWLAKDGCAIMAHYLHNHPIERGAISMRAPETSSTAEALHQSRGLYEQIIADAIEDGLSGFKSGWLSTIAISDRIKAQTGKNVTAKVAGSVAESLGFVMIGRASRAYFAESPDVRTVLYGKYAGMNIEDFGRVQGYM